METLFKICPACKCEYRPEIELCADCQVPLKYPGQESAAAPVPEALEEDPDQYLVRIDQVDYIRGLAEHLAGRGIPLRIGGDTRDESAKGRSGWGIRCALYVRREDVEAALEEEREYARAMMPEMADRLQTREVEAHACPACGTALQPHAAECPSCGLAFPDVEPKGTSEAESE